MKGKAVVVIDSIDLEIYDLIRKNKNITIGEVKEKLQITHASLTPHLKRLEEMDLIERKRDQQTIHLNITDEYSPLFYKALERLQKNGKT